jgi:hypothetical protein
VEGVLNDEFGVVALSAGEHGGDGAVAFEHVHAVGIEQDKVRVQDGCLGDRGRLGRRQNRSDPNGSGEEKSPSVVKRMYRFIVISFRPI